MEDNNKPFETLTEIRSMMERSTRFISLNGLSGVFAGIFALAGAAAAWYYTGRAGGGHYYDNAVLEDGSLNISYYLFLLTDALLVLFTSVGVAIALSVRKARRQGHRVWDNAARRLVINMLIPLVAGGLFCLILIYHGHAALVAPATLLFYGLALVNASKYTLNDIRHLGITEIILGLTAGIWIGYGLLFWAVGFGVVHIIYGVAMYLKYER